MRRIVIAIALLMILTGGGGVALQIASAPKQFAGSALRLDLEGAICSAVHIGNGIVLTAAHCVENPDGMTLKTNLNVVSHAELLWKNTDIDIALLRSEMPDVRASVLDCRTAVTGEPVEAIGTPHGMDFIHTWGRVAGAPRPLAAWAMTVPTDITMMPGMSGGPVLDRLSHLVGITVGTIGGFFGFMVPGSAICPLLARI